MTEWSGTLSHLGPDFLSWHLCDFGAEAGLNAGHPPAHPLIPGAPSGVGIPICSDTDEGVAESHFPVTADKILRRFVMQGLFIRWLIQGFPSIHFSRTKLILTKHCDSMEEAFSKGVWLEVVLLRNECFSLVVKTTCLKTEVFSAAAQVAHKQM